MFSMVFPFSEIVRFSKGKAALRDALELAFLNGGLPQGTPISPTITNIMMIPIDFRLNKTLRNYQNQSFIYTRYADDFLISSKYDFKCKTIEELVVKTLAEFDAPFSLNKAKTRYGSSAGSNWNLGVMLNKDNEITVGYKKKHQFQSMLHSFIDGHRGGTPWPKEDIQVLQGLYAYYRMVEPENIDAIIAHVNKKHDTDVLRMIHDDLR
jgi:hypothetical protein